jgi:hypothetical protein
MIDKDSPTPSPGRTSAIEIWICTYAHRHGVDAWACESESLAFATLARPCREFWEEAREIEGSHVRPEEPRLPARPPDDDRAAVDLYFEVQGEAPRPEFFQIEAQQVIGAEEAARAAAREEEPQARHEPLPASAEVPGISEERARAAGEAATRYRELARHAGHHITCAGYAGGRNVAIECEDCGEVLVDLDRPGPPAGPPPAEGPTR